MKCLQIITRSLLPAIIFILTTNVFAIDDKEEYSSSMKARGAISSSTLREVTDDGGNPSKTRSCMDECCRNNDNPSCSVCIGVCCCAGGGVALLYPYTMPCGLICIVNGITHLCQAMHSRRGWLEFPQR